MPGFPTNVPIVGQGQPKQQRIPLRARLSMQISQWENMIERNRSVLQMLDEDPTLEDKIDKIESMGLQ